MQAAHGVLSEAPSDCRFAGCVRLSLLALHEGRHHRVSLVIELRPRMESAVACVPQRTAYATSDLQTRRHSMTAVLVFKISTVALGVFSTFLVGTLLLK